MVTLALGAGKCYSLLDLGGEEEHGGAGSWTIINPEQNFNYFDTASIPSDGTKIANKEGKLDLRGRNNVGNFAVLQEQALPAAGDTWSNTWESEEEKWPTFGDECDYEIRLFRKKADGSYEHEHSRTGVVSRT
jgi:hypothetical protein